MPAVPADQHRHPQASSDELTDGEQVSGTSPGDGREALAGQDLATIAQVHGDDLYRFARFLTRDRDQAEDLVQDTLLWAWEGRETFRQDSSLRTWLHQILHNLAVDRSRRDRHELAVAAVEDRWRDDAYRVDAEVVVERAALREELQDALVRVPEALRTVVVLHGVDEWTVREIAESSTSRCRPRSSGCVGDAWPW